MYDDSSDIIDVTPTMMPTSASKSGGHSQAEAVWSTAAPHPQQADAVVGTAAPPPQPNYAEGARGTSAPPRSKDMPDGAETQAARGTAAPHPQQAEAVVGTAAPHPQPNYAGDNQRADTARGGAAHPDEISKKELLAQAGISYGQLYRWKREGLIPEQWFQKRSAFTGQETFFPRRQILERLEVIRSMKDDATLSEIREHLSSSQRQPGLRQALLAMAEIDEGFLDSLGIDLERITLKDIHTKTIEALIVTLNDANVGKNEQKEIVANVILALDKTSDKVEKVR